jgi:hypothetical protein
MARLTDFHRQHPRRRPRGWNRPVWMHQSCRLPDRHPCRRGSARSEPIPPGSVRTRCSHERGGVTSPEIQEIGEGSGAAQLPEVEEGDAWISDLARFSWAAAFKEDASIDKDEESVARRSLERELLWAHRAFNELILPATMVSVLDAVVYSCLSLFFRNL